jgi:hypothetical protein
MSTETNVIAVYEALLTEWSNCVYANDHGKGKRCACADCTFTPDLFGAVINHALPNVGVSLDRDTARDHANTLIGQGHSADYRLVPLQPAKKVENVS